MIRTEIANTIVKHNIKSFESMYNPNKITIQRIFRDNWDALLKDPEVIKRGMRQVVTYEVEKMMSCGTLEAGFELYECQNCAKAHIICYTCKSRFCNSCGTKYAKQRAANISKHTLNVTHRHMVFTIDKELRYFFNRNRDLLNVLFDSVNTTLTYVFDKMNGKNKTFKPGFILTLHTFGRDLKWNPHIHCLCTNGAMDENKNYRSIKYINYESLRKSFMKVLLDNMKKYYQDDPIILISLKALISKLYKEKTEGFYVNAPNVYKKNNKQAVVDYIIRYTGRPVMASSRIISYDPTTKIIEYYYEDHKTEEKVEVKETIIEFIKKLITHIPEQQFKMIRYYGIYATCNQPYKSKLRQMLLSGLRNNIVNKTNYRKDLITLFNTDPFLCTCGCHMEYIEYWVPKRRRRFEYENTS